MLVLARDKPIGWILVLATCLTGFSLFLNGLGWSLGGCGGSITCSAFSMYWSFSGNWLLFVNVKILLIFLSCPIGWSLEILIFHFIFSLPCWTASNLMELFSETYGRCHELLYLFSSPYFVSYINHTPLVPWSYTIDFL